MPHTSLLARWCSLRSLGAVLLAATGALALLHPPAAVASHVVTPNSVGGFSLGWGPFRDGGQHLRLLDRSG